MHRLAVLTVLAALLAVASIPAAASAVTQQRYASPAGAGTACTSAIPCSITRAVNHATNGDEVIVKPGTYNLTATLETPAPINVHGIAGKARPKLVFNGNGQYGMRVVSSTLRYVEVDQAPGLSRTAIYAWGAMVDQVIARASGSSDTAMIENGTIRNSIVEASAPNAVAIITDVAGATTTSTYRNVTAMSTGGGGIGIVASAGSGAGSSTTVNLINVIARGGGTDIEVDTDYSGAEATVNATHSNYLVTFKRGPGAAIVDGGGNQAYVPGSDKPFASEYRLAVGAPPIGAGLNEAGNGTFDVDGDPRMIGTTDIGADEFVYGPLATTAGATAVACKSATLGGSVHPNGAPTTYRFEYGPTIAYGSTTPKKSAGAYSAFVPASATLAGLTPGKKYHYRIVATNAGGLSRGADRTFTTAAAP